MTLDKYEWRHNGRLCFVERHKDRVVLAVPTIGDRREEIAAAEILRFAEERDNFKRSSEWDSEQRDLANEALRLAEEERDAAQMTAEEGQEIVGELAMSLAVIAGETLTACGDRDGKCPGHLGPKAREVADGARRIYHALREGNRVAVERIKELEGAAEMEGGAGILKFALLTNLLTEINQHHHEGEGALDTLRRIIRERQELTNARDLYRATLVALEREKQSCETIESTVERIIRERDHCAALADSRMVQIVPLRRRLEEAESDNRAKCLELAEKAGEVRELRERIQNAILALGEEKSATPVYFATKRMLDILAGDGCASMRLRCYHCGQSVSTLVPAETVVRAVLQCPECIERLAVNEPAAKLLALLDSEATPEGLLVAVLYRPISVGSASAAWRWLREQVAKP